MSIFTKLFIFTLWCRIVNRRGATLSIYGDYGIVGSGLVQVSGTLSAANLDSTTDTLSSSLITDLPARPPADSSGQWQAWMQLDTIPADWIHIKITLENNLRAVSGSGSAAWIEKSVLGNAVAIQIIPEPTTICLLTLGGLALLRRKTA